MPKLKKKQFETLIESKPRQSSVLKVKIMDQKSEVGFTSDKKTRGENH